MTDEPDGAYDWPHAVGRESHARRWRLARGIHDTEMRSGDKIDELLEAYLAQNDEITRLREEVSLGKVQWYKDEIEHLRAELKSVTTVANRHFDECKRLRGLLERADWLIQYTRRHVPADCVFENEALATYDSLKDKG